MWIEEWVGKRKRDREILTFETDIILLAKLNTNMQVSSFKSGNGNPNNKNDKISPNGIRVMVGVRLLTSYFVF